MIQQPHIPVQNVVPQQNIPLQNILQQNPIQHQNFQQQNIPVHNANIPQQNVPNQGYVPQVPPYQGYQQNQYGYVPAMLGIQNPYQQPCMLVNPYGPQYAQLPPRIMPWELARNGPLALPPLLHPVPENYLKLLPKYNSEINIDAEEHLDAFQNYMDDLKVEHEDVYMRLFVQSLEGEPRKSF